MNSSVKKIGMILLVIILLPAAVLTSYQFFSINEDEKIIQEIYGNQLNAILFSVNQYSEDIVSDWANQIDEIIRTSAVNQSLLHEKINEFLSVHNYINLIFPADSSNTENIVFSYNEINRAELLNEKNIFAIIETNKKTIPRLYTYKKSNYRKLEPLQNISAENEVVLIFIPENIYNNKTVCGIIINSKQFSEQVLSPKIQSIAQNEFIINIVNEKNGEVLYQNQNFSADKITQRRPLWLVPEGSIGILLKDSSIEELVNSKKNTFIIIISLLTISLLLGVWFVYANIKKEIKLAQIKSDFVSNVSHELRTPLALISMFAETLEMGRVNSEEKKNEYYKIISQETNRLGRIVSTILNFSKMEAGKRKFSFIETDLNSILEKVLSTYKFHLQNKGFKLVFEKDENINSIYADEEAVSEAVINLIDNAMKYSGDIKEITIKTGSADGSAFVEINDKGIGIAEEDQKKIFDKFYRVPTGLVHNVKGTGLGLTLVKQITDNHKGGIEVNSKPEKGSTFKLSFPVYKNSEEKI